MMEDELAFLLALCWLHGVSVSPPFMMPPPDLAPLNIFTDCSGDASSSDLAAGQTQPPFLGNDCPAFFSGAVFCLFPNRALSSQSPGLSCLAATFHLAIATGDIVARFSKRTSGGAVLGMAPFPTSLTTCSGSFGILAALHNDMIGNWVAISPNHHGRCLYAFPWPFSGFTGASARGAGGLWQKPNQKFRALDHPKSEASVSHGRPSHMTCNSHSSFRHLTLFHESQCDVSAPLVPEPSARFLTSCECPLLLPLPVTILIGKFAADPWVMTPSTSLPSHCEMLWLQCSCILLGVGRGHWHRLPCPSS